MKTSFGDDMAFDVGEPEAFVPQDKGSPANDRPGMAGPEQRARDGS